MIYTEPYTAVNTRDRATTFHLEVYHQPAWRHAVALAYHRWEALTWPVMRRLEWFTSGWADDAEPLTVRQDLRCYRLHHRGRVTVARVDLSEEEYHLLARTTRLVGEPSPG